MRGFLFALCVLFVSVSAALAGHHYSGGSHRGGGHYGNYSHPGQYGHYQPHPYYGTPYPYYYYSAPYPYYYQPGQPRYELYFDGQTWRYRATW